MEPLQGRSQDLGNGGAKKEENARASAPKIYGPRPLQGGSSRTMKEARRSAEGQCTFPGAASPPL